MNNFVFTLWGEEWDWIITSFASRCMPVAEI